MAAAKPAGKRQRTKYDAAFRAEPYDPRFLVVCFDERPCVHRGQPVSH